MDFKIITKEISDICSEYYKLLMSQFDKLKKDAKFKLIAQYSIVLIEYARDMCCLINNERYSTILPLNRNIVECYRHTFNLLEKYNTDDFIVYIKYLYASDMEQSMKVYNELKKDTTAGSKKETELKNILNEVHTIISNHFSEKVNEYNNNKLDKNIFKVVKDINKQYNKYSNITEEVGKSIEGNKTILSDNKVAFEDSYTIYRTLCRSSHNNITSIMRRTIKVKDGISYICPNTPDENIHGALSLTYYSIKEIYNKTKQLLEEL